MRVEFKEEEILDRWDERRTDGGQKEKRGIHFAHTVSDARVEKKAFQTFISQFFKDL